MMRVSNYDRHPETQIIGFENEVFSCADEIASFFSKLGQKDNHVLIVDCYPGVDDRIRHIIEENYKPDVFVNSDDMFEDADVLNEKMSPFLTDDRVRGVMYYGKMEDFINPVHLKSLREKINTAGKVCVMGVGASLVKPADTLIYCDLTRWEITLRYRAGMPNFKQANVDDDTLKKIKRGFFIEWRIADRHKINIFDDIDWFIDTNKDNKMTMVSGPDVRKGLKQLSQQPFRLVPYFDPGVWGGKWMEEVCDLPKTKQNYAWCFDGVPEENSICLTFNDVKIELPAMDLVLYQPIALLGMKNYCRFGAEFPIRFDFLDTMEGQNLSLQVHPLTEYIKKHYGMTYTQDESYYILDAKENGGVYLGLKDDVDPEALEKDLWDAQEGKMSFPAEKYVNYFPAKKHDHFLIPAGTIHCSAANAMVLEISATPYIFTFKLWDWDRLGLDGRPRPIHIQEGMDNIQWDRTTEWVKENLINTVETISKTDHTLEEKTGLHELEFIETRRFTTTEKTFHDTTEGFHMLNLVEGEEASVESPDESFKPFVVHYAETFIVPAAVGKYTISPTNHQEIKIIKAYVRNR